MIQNKRGISEIIGYILLIAIVVVISVFVYGFLKSFVPQQVLTCPDGTSVSLNTIIYNCTLNTLNFTFDNDGTFAVAGYYIHASNDSSQQIATIDLTAYYSGPSVYRANGNAILFTVYGSLDPNILLPGKEEDVNANGYNLSLISPIITSGAINKIEVIPIRYVEYNGKQRIASCGNEKISIPITCS